MTAIEFLEFVNSLVRIATKSVSPSPASDDRERKSISRAATSVYLRVVYHLFRDDALLSGNLIDEKKKSIIFNY